MHTNDFLISVTPAVLFYPHPSPQQVVSAVRAGVNPSGNSFNQTSLWDISSSFFFAGTVITTIGEPLLTLEDAAPRSFNAVRCERFTSSYRALIYFPCTQSKRGLNEARMAVRCQETFLFHCIQLVFGDHTHFIILLHFDLHGNK